MLADKEMFFKVGNTLRERGILEKFEEYIEMEYW